MRVYPVSVPPRGREFIVEGVNPRPFAGHSVKRESHEIEARSYFNAALEIS
jgi:hypothetical protein